MRRYRSLGLGVVSALFCASLVGACSASGNDPTSPSGPAAATDSGAATDASYSYDAGDSGTYTYDAGHPTTIDSGPVVPFDAGPMNDCDLSGSALISAIPALQSGGDGPCNATDDSCTTAGDCCVNFASLFAGGGLPTAFTALFSAGSPPVCVPK